MDFIEGLPVSDVKDKIFVVVDLLTTKTNQVRNDVPCTCWMCLEVKNEVLNDYIKQGSSSSLYEISAPCGGFCKDMST